LCRRYRIVSRRINTDIANEALHLAMQWGEHFMKPTQPRLKALHPRLTPEQRDDYDALAREVMSLANRYVDDRADCDFQSMVTAIQTQYAWVCGDNLAQLYTQGMYSAHK
jgi:hypothetical protein